jgi:hypothetical protein
MGSPKGETFREECEPTLPQGSPKGGMGGSEGGNARGGKIMCDKIICGVKLDWKTVSLCIKEVSSYEFANLALGNRKRPGGNPARGLGFFEVLEKPTVCGTRKGGFRAAFGPNGVGP